MDQIKNILYIGPYKEESNRGYYSYTNIKALEKSGHNLKIVPRFSYRYINNKISDDIVHLEHNNFDHYDICIQHCDSLQYAYNSKFSQNIGIYDLANLDPNPIINGNFFLLDKIIVTSLNKLNILQEVLSPALCNKIHYLPQLIDEDLVSSTETDDLPWMDKNRFYFYAELDFSEQYDWEKLIYVYLTTFMNKNTGLIIKTNRLDTEKKIQLIKQQIYDMASDANIKPVPKAMPQVLTGASTQKEIHSLYSSVNCLIDINKANEQSYSSVYFAALSKPIICNKYLTTSSYFKNALKTEAMVCNSSMIYYDDICNSSMYAYYYTIDSDSLRNMMLEAYQNRHKIKYTEEIQQHLMSNINNIL